MASQVRLRASQFLQKGLALLRSREIACRTIATSPKQNESSIEEQNPFPTKKQTWVSYGFSKTDPTMDEHAMHLIFFISVTVCLVCGAVVIGYRPDFRLRDWAQREAYLQLRYREDNGLPLVDYNLIDPANVVLPSDEELGDRDIII